MKFAATVLLLSIASAHETDLTKGGCSPKTDNAFGLTVEHTDNEDVCNWKNYQNYIPGKKWKFSQDACTCFFTDGTEYPPNYCKDLDEATPRLNPTEFGPRCLSNEDYLSIFHHGRYDDCKPCDDELPTYYSYG